MCKAKDNILPCFTKHRQVARESTLTPSQGSDCTKLTNHGTNEEKNHQNAGKRKTSAAKVNKFPAPFHKHWQIVGESKLTLSQEIIGRKLNNLGLKQMNNHQDASQTENGSSKTS